MRSANLLRDAAGAARLRAPPCGRSAPQQVPLQDKPFAEHKIVLQLSDGDAKKHALVLSVANNLLKAYDPDKIAIEVVAFGPGIDLLLSGSERRKQVESLIAQGVRFDICLNTVDTIERETGKTAGVHSDCDAGAGGRRADPVSGGEWVHGGAALSPFVGAQRRGTLGVVARESGRSSTPKTARGTEEPRRTGFPAFAGNDSGGGAWTLRQNRPPPPSRRIKIF